ncbi:phage holin family protein [Sphingobacterium suaedae]|uniref:Phage holin family protein n=1 Tax=Sphingobacterium suaedae TaxID=1686402 RepID=A0ABW5KNU3_9SPHI
MTDVVRSSAAPLSYNYKFMEEEKFSFNGTFQKGKEYVDTQIKLLQLKALAKGSRIAGSLVLDVTKVVLTLFIVFFCSMALGFFLGELLGSNALGFLLTGVIFFIIVLLIRAFEPKLENIFMDMTIRKLASKWDGDEDEEMVEEEKTKSNGHEEFTENK